MLSLLDLVKQDFTDIAFKTGDHFVWQPRSRTILYVPHMMSQSRGMWSLFHEVGHAKLKHHSYSDDLSLLMMEVEAWDKARTIARRYGVVIDEKHIEKCIDSYRDWLHRRSACIDCKTNSFQEESSIYKCHNCGARWQVPVSTHSGVKKRRIK